MISFSTLVASPSGNPAFPGILQKGFLIPREYSVNVRGGYEGDFVFDGNMKQVEEGSGGVDEYAVVANAGTLTLNFVDRLDLYTALGSSRFCMQWRFTDPSNAIRNLRAETENDFLWALGARGILWHSKNWKLGVNGRYSKTTNQLQWLTVDGVNAPTNGGCFSQSAWNANLGISYTIDFLSPYFAVNFEHVRSKISSQKVSIADAGSRDNHFQNKIPVGINLGCTMSTGSYFMLNVEARLINEEAVTVSGDIRF